MNIPKILLALFILNFSMILMAQKPVWTYYYQRSQNYPENEYIVGFVSGLNTNDEFPDALKEKYEALARDKVVKSIQIEIETNNTLNISNKNGNSDEEFLSKSVSFSKAEIAGLTTQSYYDRRKKEVYAFAYVNKKELAYYYRNTIKEGVSAVKQLIAEGIQFAKKGQKEKALKSLFETMPVFDKIDEARALLIALNRHMYAEMNSDEIGELQLKVNNELNTLLNPNNLSIEEAAYTLAYGLYVQIGKTDKPIFIEQLSYENTGLNSDFSKRFLDVLSASLVEIGGYQILSKKNNTGTLVVYGNYWLEGSLLKIAAKASELNNVIALNKGSLPIDWLVSENLSYIPEQVKLLNDLKGTELFVENYPETIKLGMKTTVPVDIKLKTSNVLFSTQNIPVEIINTGDGEHLCNCLTNNNSLATCFLPPINSSNKIVKLLVNIDLAQFLNITKDSEYYALAVVKNPVKPVELNILTKNPTIYLQSREEIQGKIMDINTLEPVVKNYLLELGYNFTSDEKESDFKINIIANTTSGSNYEGIYFAFLDINLAVVESKNGEEIFKIHLDQIKGGGNDYTKAGKKAYTVGAEKIKTALNESEIFN